MGTRTISLTDRPPVRIDEAKWPIIATAGVTRDPNGQHLLRSYLLRIRQHDDGRTIVYGVYRTAYQDERGARAGELLAAGADVAAAVHRVGAQIGATHLVAECIQDLPAEVA